ncbi:signal peptidase II [Mucilaginibacter sp. RS28]|uniref:Lipoprotein signal peptidase n=1 Tax=Mucilaginibacter straminoryzae TaxID=2932774 RepID=A0A9X1X664_9SPHI|nr:signal peptidase II [Mucilaginibacter straminoryzae]MCJ8210850.1 signal peptidase II [Mucilaginibacter straminoryzae]
MRKNKGLRLILILAIIAVNIGCDQLSKKIVREKLYPQVQLRYWGDHLMITRVENTGAFLSAGDNIGGYARVLFLAVLPMAALIGAMVHVVKNYRMDWLRLTAICCILGGGFGNIYDRIANGSVTDFLYLEFGIFKTGIFNLADVSITTGVILLLIVLNKPYFMKNSESNMEG